jgi:glycerophosphoryl diester phosphodiesterase
MIRNPKDSPQIVAHRGASGYAPEATLEAYRIALQMSADFVEADVHKTRDGSIVCIHDPEVSRTTNGKGRVADLTISDLKLLDSGSWFNKGNPGKARQEFVGLRIPTLQEIMDLLKENEAGIYVEIKNPELYSPDFESSLVTLVKRNDFESRVLFLSFNPQSLVKTKSLAPSIPTALLIAKLAEDPVQASLDIMADEVAIRYDLANSDLIHAAHKKGLSVSVWTVDEPEDIRRMINLGVDRIITNYPDRLKKWGRG